MVEIKLKYLNEIGRNMVEIKLKYWIQISIRLIRILN